MTFRHIAILAAALALTGCSIGYWPRVSGSSGYQERALSTGQYHLEVWGHWRNSEKKAGAAHYERLRKHFARRAGELCPNGFAQGEDYEELIVLASHQQGSAALASGTILCTAQPNQPLHPTTSGGLTAAVVAGERRR